MNVGCPCAYRCFTNELGCPCAYQCFTNELGCPCAYQCFTNELGCPCAYQSFTNEHRCNVCTLITPLPENKLETPEEDTWCHEKGLWNYELVKAGRILWLHLASVSWDKCNVPGCLRILFCWLPARCSTEGSHKHGKGPDSIIIIIIIIIINTSLSASPWPRTVHCSAETLRLNSIYQVFPLSALQYIYYCLKG